MAHGTNTAYFVHAADNSTNSLITAYCGLVAIELVLKQEIGLTSHDVPSGINSFSIQKAIGGAASHAMVLSSFRVKLINDLKAIHVQHKCGYPIAAPITCYPYIRYTRIIGDGWGPPETPTSDVAALASTVNQIRLFLKKTFGLSL